MKKVHIEYLRGKTNAYWEGINNITDKEIKPRVLPSSITHELSPLIQLLLGIRNLAALHLYFISDRDLSALGLHYRKVEAMEFEEGKDHIIYTSALPPKKLKTFITVWNRKVKMKEKEEDDELIGELLGYPRCCVKEFISPEGILAALFGSAPSFFDTFLFITHRPCSFYCQETMEINRKVEKVLLKICPEIVNQNLEIARRRSRGGSEGVCAN